jgi:mediator of RNA polymerase II transcription subunit 6
MAQPVPLDETEFDQPWLLHELPGGNLNSDSLLWYFYNSPFFDRTSNNSALINQLRSHPDGQAIMFSRQAFEEQLAKYAHGVQFKVVAEPQGPGQPWVLQKQFKTVHTETGRPITQVQATYYTQGTKIFMAPSLLDVVQLRLLTTATQLQEVYDLSKNLSRFAPGTGHSYFPPSYELPKTASTASRIGSPSLAATEPADMPASQSQSQSQAQRTAEPGETTTVFSDSLFMQSLNLTNEFYSEFADENPLKGEPGSFVFTKTHGAVVAEKEQELQKQQKAAAQAASAGQAASTDVKTETQSTVTSVAATPKTGVLAASAAPDPQSRKGSVAGVPKIKRKKSKGLGTPVTPTAPQF